MLIVRSQLENSYSKCSLIFCSKSRRICRKIWAPWFHWRCDRRTSAILKLCSISMGCGYSMIGLMGCGYLQVAVKSVTLVKSLTVLWCWNMGIWWKHCNSLDIERFANAQVCLKSRSNPRSSQRSSQNRTHQQSNEGHSTTFGDLPRHLH